MKLIRAFGTAIAFVIVCVCAIAIGLSVIWAIARGLMAIGFVETIAVFSSMGIFFIGALTIALYIGGRPMTMTKEQIAQLPGLVKRFDCHGWDIRRGIMRQADNGAWVQYDDYATLAATVIEQQAEIERLRGNMEMPDDFIYAWHEVTEWCAKEGETVEARTAWGKVVKRIRSDAHAMQKYD